MRSLFFIMVLAFSAFAQTPFVSQNFEAGNVAARQGRYESAIEKYRAALLQAETTRLSDEFAAKIHFNIGVCLYHLQRTEEAVVEYTEAVNLSGRKYQKAFYALGMAQKDLKNRRSAESALQSALNIDRTDGEAWFDLALLYLEEKDYDSAEKAFADSIKYQSVSAPDAHNNLGVIAALKHDWNLAESEFEAALKNPNDKSTEAAGNLRFCKFYKQNHVSQDLLAKLEFSRTLKTGE